KDLRYLRSYVVAPDQFKRALFSTHVAVRSSGPTQCAARQYAVDEGRAPKINITGATMTVSQTHWLTDSSSVWAFDAKNGKESANATINYQQDVFVSAMHLRRPALLAFNFVVA